MVQLPNGTPAKTNGETLQMHFRFGLMRTVPDRSNASPNCSDKQRTECSVVRCVRGGRAHHPSQITPREKSLPLTSCNNTTTTTKRNQVVYHYSSQLTNTKLNRVTSQTSSSPLRKKGRSHTQLQQQQPIPFEIFVKYHQQQTKQPINYSFINLNQQTNKQRKEQETWVFQDFSNGSQRDIPARLHQSMTPRCPRSITYTWT